ncbi:MAG: hypothetical protein OEM15_08340 [Myxococcales bacterium]|nr:hypothetical protein [Myxococcales bacterium]MDH3484232.1 hypothetical protein [Myxococcales bacterium]
MTKGKSGKRVVAILLGFVVLAVFIAWVGFKAIQGPGGPEGTLMTGAPRVLAEGVIYEAKSGDPAVVTAQNIRSGKLVWRSELGTITTQPVLVVEDDVIEVQVAGTSWMTLERTSGRPVE